MPGDGSGGGSDETAVEARDGTQVPGGVAPASALRPPADAGHAPPTPASPRRRESPRLRIVHSAATRALRELPPDERPRERLLGRGPAALTNAELIALVWGSGAAGRNAVELAADGIAAHGGIAGLAGASIVELRALPGVGTARAAQLVAAFELGRRLLADWPIGRFSIRAPRDLADRLIPQMGRLEREELRVVLLNTKNQVLSVQTVYQGNVSTALVRVAELFHDAVRQSAAGMILAHNHPSGDPTPSPDDVHLTAESVAAGRLLDIPVLDHLVIGHDAYISMRDQGVPFDRPGGR